VETIEVSINRIRSGLKRGSVLSIIFIIAYNTLFVYVVFYLFKKCYFNTIAFQNISKVKDVN